MALLELRNVNKSFNGVKVLNNINLEIREGEVHVLLGENGAGKSTIIKLITGAYSLDDGQILWKGEPVNIQKPVDAMNLGIATIYQELNLALDLSVQENIFLGRDKKGYINKI